ncbi:MAG: phage Gp37/Gp68 family protein [Deltaproteobacteria bacterium]|nr:phage Gp37/Gp68 family protein [Deltaproteobacteria bacterium]
MDWLTVGGENRPLARPMKAKWVRKLFLKSKNRLYLFSLNRGEHSAQTESKEQPKKTVGSYSKLL